MIHKKLVFDFDVKTISVLFEREYFFSSHQGLEDFGGANNFGDYVSYCLKVYGIKNSFKWNW